MPCMNSDLVAEMKGGIERLPLSRAEHVHDSFGRGGLFLGDHYNMFTVRALLLVGKSDEAMQYAARLEQSPAAQSILSACKNSLVHSFLRHRLQELKGKEISSSFDVTLAPVVGISDTDLIIALGNLLDNAVEACAAAQERRIRLTVRQTDGSKVPISRTYRQSAIEEFRRKNIAVSLRQTGLVMFSCGQNQKILQPLERKEAAGSYYVVFSGIYIFSMLM